MQIDHIPLVIIVTLTAILGVSCIQFEPGAPPDGGSVTWNVHWSYTAGNNLVGGNPGSKESQWRAVLGESTNYNVVTGLYDTVYMPSDIGLHYNTLRAQMENFVGQFYSNAFIVQIAADSESVLFGVRTPSNTPEGVLGRTFAKGEIANVHNVAVSLVFKSKIDTISSINTERKWWVTQYVVIHELGHARGLNAISDDFDHNYHTSGNAPSCIMRNLIIGVFPSSHVFCDYHKRVLKQCLTTIQASYPGPNDSCAQPQ